MRSLEKIYFSFLLIAISGFFARCSHEGPPAEAFMKTYFQTLEQKEWNKVTAFYDNQFYEAQKIKAGDWLGQLQNMNALLGPIKKWELVSWTDHFQQGAGSEGKYYVLNYTVTYANDIAEESFILHQSDTNKTFKILNWNPNPQKIDLPHIP
jgi:hypothetical protein